jgi:hypothetical protein
MSPTKTYPLTFRLREKRIFGRSKAASLSWCGQDDFFMVYRGLNKVFVKVNRSITPYSRDDFRPRHS